MAPQGEIPVAANVLGTIGTIFWCVQLVPQIWTNWRKKHTEGLPPAMMFLWAVAGVPFGVYAIVQKFNVPIQVQPHLFMVLCLFAWCQVLYYNGTLALWKAITLGLVTGAIFGGAEVALILTLKPVYDAGNETCMLVIGIIAAVLIAVGLLPPYGEIWKRRGRVIGINWIFLGMDWCGAFFSLMALVAQNTFDTLGSVMYIICCMLEIGIFGSHLIWRFRTRKIRKQAAAEGKTFDDLEAEHLAQGIPFKFAQRRSRRDTRKAETMDLEAADPGHGSTGGIVGNEGELHAEKIR